MHFLSLIVSLHVHSRGSVYVGYHFIKNFEDRQGEPIICFDFNLCCGRITFGGKFRLSIVHRKAKFMNLCMEAQVGLVM